MQVIEHDLFQLFINLLLFAKDNVALALDPLLGVLLHARCGIGGEISSFLPGPPPCPPIAVEPVKERGLLPAAAAAACACACACASADSSRSAASAASACGAGTKTWSWK